MTSTETFETRAAAWLEENVPARWREHRGALSHEESDAIRRDWDRRLWAGGYSSLPIPAEFGGGGVGLAEDIAFAVLAAEAEAPDGFGRVGKTLTAPMLVKDGTQEQQERFLPDLVAGEKIWVQGFSEPDAGSDLAGVATRAVKVEGGYRLTGRKTWTTFAQHADGIFVLAVTDPDAPRHRNLSMLMVDMHQPGVSIHDIRQISGAVHFAETQFDDVFVPADDRIGAEGDGWKVAMRVLGEERGGSETAARYVEIRADVNLLMSSLAGRLELRDVVDDLDVRAELLRWQLNKVVALEGEDDVAFARAAAVLKVTWSELWQNVTEVGVRAMVPEDREHWRYQYLEARAASIYSGTNEIQRNIISERVMGLPR